MKKFLAGVLAIGFIFAFAACGPDSECREPLEPTSIALWEKENYDCGDAGDWYSGTLIENKEELEQLASAVPELNTVGADFNFDGNSILLYAFNHSPEVDYIKPIESSISEKTLTVKFEVDRRGTPADHWVKKLFVFSVPKDAAVNVFQPSINDLGKKNGAGCISIVSGIVSKRIVRQCDRNELERAIEEVQASEASLFHAIYSWGCPELNGVPFNGTDCLIVQTKEEWEAVEGAHKSLFGIADSFDFENNSLVLYKGISGSSSPEIYYTGYRVEGEELILEYSGIVSEAQSDDEVCRLYVCSVSKDISVKTCKGEQTYGILRQIPVKTTERTAIPFGESEITYLSELD